MTRKRNHKGRGRVVLVHPGARRFAFYVVAPYGRGAARLTAWHKTARTACAALSAAWPQAFYDWTYTGESETRTIPPPGKDDRRP